ncbi:MAG: hypothetical protein PHI12_02495 [Dehalococcoidales bacterium]|nr:hypothetical protein [Dehalococcoidales bacterium]
MEWRVQLSGDKSDLEELAKSLNSDELKIWEDDGKFILSSSDFDSLNESQDVRDNAEIKLNYINGCAKLKQSFQQPITIDGVESLSQDGKRSVYISVPPASIVVRTHNPTVLINGREEGAYIYDELGRYVLIAKKDNNVAEVFNCLKEEDDPRTLFNIFEIIRSDVGGEENIRDNGWASLNKIRLFRQTVNFAGEKARHRGGKHPPPKNPMSLAETKTFIHNLVKCWLDSKIPA